MTFQELLKDEREEGRAEGRAEGLVEGQTEKMVSLVQKKLERGDSIEKIADDLMEDVDVIRQIIGN